MVQKIIYLALACIINPGLFYFRPLERGGDISDKFHPSEPICGESDERLGKVRGCYIILSSDIIYLSSNIQARFQINPLSMTLGVDLWKDKNIIVISLFIWDLSRTCI